MSFKADAKVRAPRPIGPIDDENDDDDDDDDDDAKKSSVRFGYALCTRARDMTIYIYLKKKTQSAFARVAFLRRRLLCLLLRLLRVV